MGLLDTILGAQDGAVLKQLAGGFGISESDASNAAKSPARPPKGPDLILEF